MLTTNFPPPLGHTHKKYMPLSEMFRSGGKVGYFLNRT